MPNDLTAGFDVVAHFSQGAVERIFQSSYLSGIFPNHVSKQFSQGGATHTVEIFFHKPDLRFVSVPGIKNAVRLRFGYLVRMTNHDWETEGAATIDLSAVPITMARPDGTNVISLGIDLSSTGLGQFTFTAAQYPEFESVVKPLIAASLIGERRSIFLTPNATPTPERITFKIYPGTGGTGFAAAFVTAAPSPLTPPAEMTSYLASSQDLAVALPVELVEQLVAEGLATMGLGHLPADLEIDGEQRRIEAISFRLRDHYLEVTGKIDSVEFEAKALLLATPDGFRVQVQTLDVDLPWYLDVVDFLGGGVIQRAISEAFPSMLGTIGSGATGGLAVFSTNLPGTDTIVQIRNMGYAGISRQGMIVGATTTPAVLAPVPIRQPTYVRGNRRSREFHRPGCPYGDKVKNFEQFVRESAAIRAGYNGCFTCAHEYSHPYGRLVLGFRSEGNQANALLTVKLTVDGKLMEPVVVDDVPVTDPPFATDITLKVKVKPDGSWQHNVYNVSSQVIPGKWRLRARSGGWTGECVGLVKPTARNFGATNMFAFTIGKPAGNFGYDTMPPFP